MAERNYVTSQIATICRKVFNNENLEINDTTSANDIFEWDSMTNLLLIDELENQFEIKFTLDEILNAKNIGDLSTIIINRKNN